MEEDKDNTTGTDQQYQKAVSYADNLSIQLRKELYCLLRIGNLCAASIMWRYN